ncbi:radical SAM protein [Promethearchaeum syntrophicum]|uniref:Radical SAM protein n=1 Tax=Promethearchaeum syntrophicum TaxID=2594042 RepID=A0A5B9DE68_9ARCH|nr:radical SAM protein [Candidatus Prometheoarchaeum syntrophicum]QEE17609.1 coproporphyrinogen III oxidase [Candidatus Prometheoarchaeum syntrophicum]
MLPPDQIVIRPPIEAYSVLIPITGGCSWNRCRFCGVYKNLQDYKIRKLDNVLKDIKIAGKYNPNSPYIFLAGGNALSVPTDYLLLVLHEIRQNFPFFKRISIYAKILDISHKSDEELRQLAQAGLTICYIGMETGSDTVLKNMKKGQTSKMMIKEIPRLMRAGIQASLYIILGLGGKKLTIIHADETARVLNAVNPTFFRFRTLNIMPNAPLKEDIEAKTFEILSPLEILKEERSIIAQLSSSLTSALRNDHVSNYTYVQSDNIGKDKEKILRILDDLIANPDVGKWKHKNLRRM